MKKSILFVMLLSSLNCFSQATETFYDFSARTILGDTISMSSFAGKKVMVVNTASFCGYTHQYADLQSLYDLYSGNNFEIIGFPCNDFGGQEPFDDSTIHAYVTSTYHIAFQMMSKIHIAVPDTCDLYEWLQLQSRNGVADAPVTWNFHKYLIDEAGHWVAHHPSTTNPLDPAIVNWILSQNTTGISSPSGLFSTTLLSNPVNETIRLDIQPGNGISGYRVKLFSPDGKLLKIYFEGFLQSARQFEFSASDLQNGIFFLSVENENSSKMMKLVVGR